MADGTQTADTTTDTTTVDTSTTAVTRPDYLPESYWDTATNAPKADALKTDLADLATLRTEKETRAATIPAKPEDYKIELPEGFEIPGGLEFKPDPADPLFADFQKFAKERNYTQDDARHLVGFYANILLRQNQGAEAARGEQMKALGAAATTRVDAAKRWLSANVSEPQARVLSYALNTKDGVEAVEALVAKLGGVQARGGPGNGDLKAKPPGAELIDDIGKPGTAAKMLRAAHAQAPH